MSAPKQPAKTPTYHRPDRAGHRPVGLRRVKVGKREIVTQGIAPAVLQDLYHYFMTVGWFQLFGTFAAFFLAFDVLFGFLYHFKVGDDAFMEGRMSIFQSGHSRLAVD